MRRLVLLAVFGLLLWACTAGGSTTTTVAPSTAPSASTTSTTSTTTTSPTPVWPEILVTNQDGVFYIDAAGEVTQLVKGRVAYAVDDARGGLLFQVERGRSTVWASWQSVYGEHLKDTRVWWVPAGSAAPQALLVPTPGAGQDLVLYDAYQVGDEHLRVVYVRTHTPEGENSYFRLTDSLRLFDAETTTVTELWNQGAWEEGFSWVSAGAGLLAATQHQQIGTRCFFLDPAAASQPGYDPRVLESWVEVEGVPAADPACEECCVSRCVLSPDGELAAYTRCSEIDVVRLRGPETRLSFNFDEVASLDLTNTGLLVNRYPEVGEDDGWAALVDISDESMVQVPVPGSARFVSTPISIDGPVIPPAMAAIQLRADGLGVVDFGDPVEEVMAVLTNLLGPPDWEEIQISADTDFSVRWGEDGAEFLYLQFTYWDYFDAAPEPPGPMPEGPVFHYYLTKSELLSTEAGVTVGSTVSELSTAYPDVRFQTGCYETEREFVVDPPAGWLQLPMWGLLDSEHDHPSSRIVYLGAGWDRTPC